MIHALKHLWHRLTRPKLRLIPLSGFNGITMAMSTVEVRTALYSVMKGRGVEFKEFDVVDEVCVIGKPKRGEPSRTETIFASRGKWCISIGTLITCHSTKESLIRTIDKVADNFVKAIQKRDGKS